MRYGGGRKMRSGGGMKHKRMKMKHAPGHASVGRTKRVRKMSRNG